MRYLIALMAIVCVAHADDHVTVTYNPGFSAETHTVSIRIDQRLPRGEVVSRVYNKLETINKLGIKSCVVPDAKYITISAEMNGSKLEVSSCHVIVEKKDNLVVTVHGIRTLDGMTRDQVLSKQPENFIRFRKLWEEAFAIVMKLASENFLLKQEGWNSGNSEHPNATDIKKKVLDTPSKSINDKKNKKENSERSEQLDK